MQAPLLGAHRPIPFLTSVAALAGTHDVWFADIWGVMHNGIVPFAQACDACTRFRLAGGTVVLLSNAPRPATAVAAQLDRIGVPRLAYDVIVSSGDAARALMTGLGSSKVFHLGPERDLGLYDGLDAELVAAGAARLIVCTGPFDDETETPDDYTEMLAGFAARSVPMICANPDLFVERGSKLVYCAGALAERYEALGGVVQYAGKPHLPVYEMAFGAVSRLRKANVARDRILAIGDGLRTDILGAARAGLASLYIASAVHMKDGDRLDDAATLSRLFPDPAVQPIGVMDGLKW